MTCACGAGLMSMVARFSIGKKSCQGNERFLKKVLRDADRSRALFLKLSDDDCAAYAARDTRKMLAVPREVARAAQRLISLCPDLALKGNALLASDTAIAAGLLEAGFTGACWNIAINHKGKRRAPAFSGAGQKKVKVFRMRTEENVGVVIGR